MNIIPVEVLNGEFIVVVVVEEVVSVLCGVEPDGDGEDDVVAGCSVNGKIGSSPCHY